MATFGDAVKGITDLRVTTVTGDTPGGTHTDIVGVKGLSVQVSSDSDQQTGDDSVLYIVQANKVLDVNFSSANGNLAALAVLTNTTVTATGTTPNRVNAWSDPAVANTAYVQLVGQAQGRDATGSAMRVTVLKAQVVGGPNWDFSDDAWLEPEVDLQGVGRDVSGTKYLYKIENYETAPAFIA